MTTFPHSPVAVQTVVPGSTRPKEHAMTAMTTAIQTLYISLLLDRRAQAAVAITLALLAGLVLGPGGAEAGVNQGCRAIITGRC